MKLNDFAFDNSLRELHNTFITTNMDSCGSVAIEFQNPSIHDFLVYFLGQNIGLQDDIIKGAAFYNQLFEIFTQTSNSKNKNRGLLRKEKIQLSKKSIKTFTDKIISEFKELSSSKISQMQYKHAPGKIFWRPNKYGVFKKLNILIDNDLFEIKVIEELAIKIFLEQPLPKSLEVGEQNDYLTVVKTFNGNIDLDAEQVMHDYIDYIYFASQVDDFKEFEDIFPEEYGRFIIEDEKFKRKLENIVKQEFREANEENFSDVISELEKLGEDFNFDVSNEIGELKKKAEEYEAYIESRVEDMDFDRKDSDVNDDFKTENDRIEDLFQSLR